MNSHLKIKVRITYLFHTKMEEPAMLIGYARVSTNGQTVDSQTDRLSAHGCEKIISEIASAGKQRPQLEELLSWIRSSDTLFCTKMDRLARSLTDLTRIMELIRQKGANISFLDQAINTTNPAGKLSFSIFAAVAEFERDIIKERTKDGLKAARARGRLGGRPRAINDRQLVAIFSVYDQNQVSINELCSMFDIKKQTFYGYLKKRSAMIATQAKILVENNPLL